MGNIGFIADVTFSILDKITDSTISPNFRFSSAE
jgi:hypothetical protein